MNIKKIFADVLIITIAFALFILWYENKFEKNTVPASSVKNYVVYLITMDKTSQYWYTLDRGASDMADMLGLTYKWDAPQERNVDEQIVKINNAVSAGANALLIAASDPVRVSEAIANAKAAGVKIIYVDAPANEEGIITLATNNYGAGATAATNMINELEAIGSRSGSIGIVGVTKENITTSDREKGFRDVMNKDGRYKILDTQYSAGNKALGKEIALSFIHNNPDLVGLFGTNEDTTEGVGNAIKESNKNIVGIGFDINNTIQQMIRNGYLKAVMVQNPYTMGYLGMAQAYAALNGFDTGPHYLDTGVSVKTQFTH
ncbi:MAG TPA: substrate-binding domain-containing protein [Mobilitalea sp.]|nr:substrate-binding domain-containing protein [Mobilitalea sp.]